MTIEFNETSNKLLNLGFKKEEKVNDIGNIIIVWTKKNINGPSYVITYYKNTQEYETILYDEKSNLEFTKNYIFWHMYKLNYFKIDDTDNSILYILKTKYIIIILLALKFI